MKKTILKSVMLTAIASLAMSGYVAADHMSPMGEEFMDMPNDNHDDIIEQFEEDGDFMGDALMAADSEVSMSSDGSMGSADPSATNSIQSMTMDAGESEPLNNAAAVSERATQAGVGRSR